MYMILDINCFDLIIYREINLHLEEPVMTSIGSGYLCICVHVLWIPQSLYVLSRECHNPNK